MNKNGRLILAITIGILCTFGMVSSSTYSLWRITKTQSTPNDIVAACLDISMQNESGSFGLSDAWPMTDEEGMQLEGYTFEVKNNCNNKISYIIGLNSLEIESGNYFQLSSIKVQLDDNNPRIYSDLNTLDYLNVRMSKLLNKETIEGGATNKHNVKVWVNENTPVSEQSKEFEGQVYITAGQGILSSDDCFTVNENGLIIDYEETCGSEVVVPAAIGGVNVTQINQNSFDSEITSLDLSKAIHLQAIGNKSFYQNSISELLLPQSGALTTIESSAFSTNQLTEIIIPNTVVNISSFAFSDNQIEKVILPKSITRLEAGIFSNNDLENIDIPKGVTTIDAFAFSSNLLEKVTVPKSVKYIDGYAFHSNKISSIIFEGLNDNTSLLTTIGEHCFTQNELTKVVLPSSVTTIKNFAFSYNKQLSDIIIKRQDSSGMSLSTYWSSLNFYRPDGTVAYANVIYDPNYTE